MRPVIVSQDPIRALGSVERTSSTEQPREIVDMAQGRIAAVEGLRGLAFLSVHFFHSMTFGPGIGSFHLAWVYAVVVGQGWIGVDLFYVLSGFLITGAIFRAMGNGNWMGRFYLRRALRIMPLYFMVLLASLFLIPLVFRWTLPLVETPRSNLAWYVTFTHNWLNLKVNGWPEGDPMIGQLWSLAVEEQFYVVWPLTVVLLTRRWLGRIAMGILLAAPAVRLVMIAMGWKYEVIYALTICRADALAAGAMVAILATRNRLPSPRVAWGLALAGGILFFASSKLIGQYGSGIKALHLQNGAFTWSLALWAGLLIVALRRGLAARLLSFKPLRFIGFYSYTLYLVSYPLCFIAGTYWKSAFGDDSTLGHFLFMGSTLGASLLISMASWHLLEKRFLSFAGKAPVFR